MSAPSSRLVPRRRDGGWRPELIGLGLVSPAFLGLLLVCFLPLFNIGYLSVTEPELGLGNYIGLYTDGVTFESLLRTIAISIGVMVGAVIVAYPYAYAMTVFGPMGRALLITIVLMPFWTSMMARNFAWVALMKSDGVISQMFELIGIHGVVLIRTPIGVMIAMTQVLLPFVILPLYSSMEQIDHRLMEAGQSLGASRLKSFWTIFVPLSLPGVVAGATLVFVLSLGFYVTPALIGSPQGAMIAQIMSTRVQVLLDLGGAGALGVFLLALTLLTLGLSRWLVGRGRWGNKPDVATADPVGSPREAGR